MSNEIDVIVVKKHDFLNFIEKCVRLEKKERQQNMPECVYINRIFNMPRILNMQKF